MQLVCMRHQGVLCALPSDQARLAEHLDAVDTEQPLKLFDAGAPLQPADSPMTPFRALRVRAAATDRTLPCSRVRTIDIEPEARLPLPPLLAGVLALPHVVGVVELEGTLVWLLDLRRLPPGFGSP